jgi:cysteine-rich repeat protein
MCTIPGVCGNHIVDLDEVCDDGNRLDGDGCSHDCLSCGDGEACRSRARALDDPDQEAQRASSRWHFEL